MTVVGFIASIGPDDVFNSTFVVFIVVGADVRILIVVVGNNSLLISSILAGRFRRFEDRVGRNLKTSGMWVTFCKVDSVGDCGISVGDFLVKFSSVSDQAKEAVESVVIFLKISSLSKRGIAKAIAFSLSKVLK